MYICINYVQSINTYVLTSTGNRKLPNYNNFYYGAYASYNEQSFMFHRCFTDQTAITTNKS